MAGDYEYEFDGLIKLRLVHRPGASVFLVDQIVVTEVDRPYWLQPQWTYPPQLHFFSDGAVANVWVATVGTRKAGANVEVEIDGDALVASLSDRSHIYRAKLRGPEDLRLHKAGIVRLRADGAFDLRLYHHTTQAAKSAIQSSGEVWGSAWNFQGNKKLANCVYAYFTNLPGIRTEADLRRIAMASEGQMALRLDQSLDHSVPDAVIEVYRGSTRDRDHTVWLWVPAEHVAPPHVFLHQGVPVEYETAQPFIYRVGLTVGGSYRLAGNDTAAMQPDLRRFDYVILGDCTTLAGLVAPYDEENTTQTFEIEDLGSQTIHEFWLTHGNQPLYTGEVERQEFAHQPSE